MVNDELNMVVPEDWNIKHLDDLDILLVEGHLRHLCRHIGME